MRSLLARLAVLGALAVSMSACSGGNGQALSFAGPPNNAGGTPGQFQSGSNGQMLLRFIQGSPDPSITSPSGTVDVCVDDLPLGSTGGTASYGKAAVGSAGTGTLFSVSGGIPHVLTVYNNPPPGGQVAGAECPTAPGPFFGSPPIATTTLTPGNNVRWTVVLGGTKASGTYGLYIFGEPTYGAPPAGFSVISHNAAPAFSVGKANGVGFGQCTTTVTPCTVAVTLLGTQGVAPGKPSTISTSVVNGTVNSGINAIPAGFYDGIGVAAGTPVPITSVAAPNAAAGQPYVIALYAFDGPAGGLNLLAVPESTLGYGF